jgi:4-diphosphocytidyl-2-C-methyl-D-erythritol kinase
MTRSLTLAAHAKINLYLDVLGRLPNGYHAVETLYQSVALADTLHVERRASGVVLESDDPNIPRGNANLVVRAAELFFRFTGIAGGVHVGLDKRIPMGAGLGGGSADAAGTLCALNVLYGTRYPKGVLARLGARIGADVPFCVRGGTAWGFGTGRHLRPAPPLAGGHVLLVNPGAHVDTAWAYRALRMPLLRPPARHMRLTSRPEHDTILRAWARALAEPMRLEEACVPLLNRFDDVVCGAHPTVAAARDALRSRGAVAAMSGSGATVFGIFPDGPTLAEAAQHLHQRFPFVMPTCFVAQGVEIVAQA